MSAPACWRAELADAQALSRWLAERPMWGTGPLLQALAGQHVQVWCAGANRAVPDGALWLNVAGSYIDICDLYVAPKARRRGIGRALVVRAIEVAEGLQATGVSLEVAVNNQGALALYQRCGFSPVRVRPGYYEGSGGPTDAWLMSRPCSAGAR